MAISSQERIQVSLKYTVIAGTSRGRDIRNRLEVHPVVKSAEGKLWLNHLVYGDVDSIVRYLTCWYLWFEDAYGQKSADIALNRYLDSGSIETTFVVWVYGIKPEKSYHFCDSSLVPVSDMPDSRERDDYLSLISNLESPVAHAAFIKKILIPRIVENEKEARDIQSQLILETHEALVEESVLVNGINELSCLPHWKCAYQEYDVPFGPWGKVGKSRTCFDTVGTHSRIFSDKEADLLVDMISCYRKLEASEKQWIQIILERIQKSKRQGSIENKILDLGIATEMLLLKDLGERDPISFPFRFRGSWLLGKDFNSRKEIHDALKIFYNFRCVIAHEGVFKKNKDVKRAQQMLPDFYAFTEDVLQLAIRPEYPRCYEDWLSLILGVDESKGGL